MGYIFGAITASIGLAIIALAVKLEPDVFIPVAGGFFGIWLLVIAFVCIKAEIQGKFE